MTREDRLPVPDADAGAPRQHDPRARAPATPDTSTVYCDLCGNAMLDLHCKLVCGRCGYKRDCSDP